MTAAMSFSNPELIAAMAFAGFAFGLCYFFMLRRTVALFTVRRGWIRPVALSVVRIAAAILLLGIAARLGAIVLLATFLGFLLARTVMLRIAKGTD